ncbi:MAG: hypothetical protein MUO82_03795 [Candidatus Thermoplasmatota archaeon]|nr:hypothetical protein [Candidatus Thermoplasmatota archaeon]
MQKEIVEKFFDAKCLIFFELESGTKCMGRILKAGESVLLALTDIPIVEISEEEF